MKKRILSMILAALMVVSLMPATVFAATVSPGAEYTMKNAAGQTAAIKWKVTKQSTNEFTLEIYGTGAIPKMAPSSYPWYSTASSVNTDKNLKHLIIGGDVTNLPDFYGGGSSSAKYVNLTDITINSKHFDADISSAMRFHDNLTTVTFGEGVETVSIREANVFSACEKLAAINLPASLKSFQYHSQTFVDDTAFTTITLAEGNNVFSLENNVLYNKAKTELILAPTGLTVTPVSTVQKITAGLKVDAANLFSTQVLNDNIQITLKHNKDGKTPTDNVFYVGEMIEAQVTAKEGSLPDGLFYAWLGMNGDGTAIDNDNTSKIAGFETSDTFLDGKEYLMSPNALYGAVKITYFPAADYTYRGTANGRFAVCQAVEGKAVIVAYQDFTAVADQMDYTYDKAIRYLVNDLSAIMVKGETRTVSELLGRSGVTHITCSTVSISNVVNKNSSKQISVSKDSIKAVDIGEDIPVGFDIAIGNGICLYHNHTGSNYNNPSPIKNNTFKIRVIKEPQFRTTGSQIIVTNPIPEAEYFIGQTKGVLSDGAVYFNQLDSDTEYTVVMHIQSGDSVTYPYAVNVRTGVSVLYTVTNGTPESAKETNHGYIAIDKATAAEGDTVTVEAHPAEGYQLKSLTVTPVAPAEYTVTFDLNGITGTAPEAQTIKYGGKVNKPADPTADGYTFGGWYKEATCTNAWDFANDTVTANTTLYAKWKPEDEGSYILKAQGNWFKAFSETTTDKTKITDITFCKELPQGVSAENPVNLTDDEEKGKVKGYIVANGDNYKIYIVGDYIFGNSVCYNMFSGFSNLKTLDFGNFDTSNVTVMFNMFSGCSGLTFLDLSSFDTSETSNMQSMFTGCSKLESITFGTKFNTSKVTSMVSMFSGCSALKSLDLSSFDTSAVNQGMNSMFQNCSTLTSLNLGSFDTSNVTAMGSMFNGCSALKSLDLSKFDTSAVKDMNGMFTGCSKLESITFGTNFDTSKVIAMNAMFSGCSALKSLDLSSFDTSAVTNIDAMFKNCAALESLDLSKFDTSAVAKMSNMFNGCSTLERLDISNFTVGNGTTVDDMFKDCSELTSVKIISDENEKIKNALGDGWIYNGETKAYEKAPANKLLKSPAPKLLKSPAPAAPETITPAKQTDGTYQFTMPGYAVTVTAEFEEKAITIADILPDDFPTCVDVLPPNLWVNGNEVNMMVIPSSLVIFTLDGDGNPDYVELANDIRTATLTKNGNNYTYTNNGVTTTFLMSDNGLESVKIEGLTGEYVDFDGTYGEQHAHSFTYTVNGGKLTATCTAGCDKGYDTTPLTLTLTAPTSLVYDGNAKAFIFADGEATAWTGAGLELPTIIYQIKQSGQSTYLPLMSGTLKDVGNYMAQITVGEKTAQVEFAIGKATPYLKTNPEPTDIVYGKKLSDSTLFGGYVQVSSTNTTQVGGLFEWKLGDTIPALSDSETTEYDVTFTPADTNNYNTVSCKVKIKVTHTHNPVKVTGQAATETAAGWSDYYECKDSTDACHKYFEDATAKVEIIDLDAWKAQGGKGYIAPLVHSITPVNGKNATDTEAGYKPYYECKNCGKYYEDATGLIEISNISAWKSENGSGYLAPLHGTDADHDHLCDACGQPISEHNMIDVDGVAATLESAGFRSCYRCDICGKFFEDADAKVEIADIDVWKADGGNGYLPKLLPEPQTGDNNMMPIWLVLLSAAVVGLVTCGLSLKKRRNEP